MTKKISFIGIAVRGINAAVEFLKEKFGLRGTEAASGRGINLLQNIKFGE